MAGPTNLFAADARASMRARLQTLRPDSPRQWGRMNAAQMLAHCTAAFGDACGDREVRQVWIGKLIGPLALKYVLGDRPMQKNAPTAAALRIGDDRDFAVERERLEAILGRFCAEGPSAADGRVHVLFGRMSGDEWGRLLYKHLDHHLRQFGV